jgi:hypothetical protein
MRHPMTATGLALMSLACQGLQLRGSFDDAQDGGQVEVEQPSYGEALVGYTPITCNETRHAAAVRPAHRSARSPPSDPSTPTRIRSRPSITTSYVSDSRARLAFGQYRPR